MKVKSRVVRYATRAILAGSLALNAAAGVISYRLYNILKSKEVVEASRSALHLYHTSKRLYTDLCDDRNFTTLFSAYLWSRAKLDDNFRQDTHDFQEALKAWKETQPGLEKRLEELERFTPISFISERLGQPPGDTP